MLTRDPVSQLAEIRSLLTDDVSKEIFDARMHYLLDRNEEAFTDRIFALGNIYRSLPLDDMLHKLPDINTLVIFGTGHYGRMTCKLLENSKYRDFNILFCNGRGTPKQRIRGRDVISIDELVNNHPDSVVLISSGAYKDEMMRQLNDYRFPREQVFYEVRGHLVGICGNQYLDFFDPGEREVFVDAGAFDAEISYFFSEWYQGKYDKIYGFEAGAINARQCRKNIERWGLKNYTLIEKAVWSDRAALNFESSYGYGSCVAVGGSSRIEADSIDNVLHGERVTFIKMDVEGCEYEALVGARESILKWAPRLAVSIYHKDEDILRIPAYIHELDPDYKFAIRHYSSFLIETVLYAWK